MITTTSSETHLVPASSSLGAKLLNLFVSPSSVFEEVAASPSKPLNWLVPTGLICLASLLALNSVTDSDRTAAALQELVTAGKINQAYSSSLSAHWNVISIVATCLCPFFGVLWSGFVLWLMGRVLLGSRFPFNKALEVAGLSGIIIVLGTVVTWLLALAAGDALARPALSLLLLKLQPADHWRASAEVLNCFYLWTTAVLAIGLSKLSGAGFKESAFWVFGFWVAARIALILLS